MYRAVTLWDVRCFRAFTVHLVHRGPFIYSRQRGTVGGISDLAHGEPELDDIEFLEIQDWSGNSVRCGVGFRQESGTLNTGITLTLPVILYRNPAIIGVCSCQLELLWNFQAAERRYVCIDLTGRISWYQGENLSIAEGLPVEAYIVRSKKAWFGT